MALCFSWNNVLLRPCRYALQRQRLSRIPNAIVRNPNVNSYYAEFCFGFHQIQKSLLLRWRTCIFYSFRNFLYLQTILSLCVTVSNKTCESATYNCIFLKTLITK